MRPLVLACALALFVVHCKKTQTHKDDGPLPLGASAGARFQDCDIDATIVPERTRFGIHEEVGATFRATVDCDQELTLLLSGDLENKFGRSEAYHVSARTSEGEELATRKGGEMNGGGSGRVAFTRAKPFESRLVLSNYLVFPHAGRWEVLVDKALTVGKKPDGGSEDRKSEQWLRMKVSMFVDVEGS